MLARSRCQARRAMRRFTVSVNTITDQRLCLLQHFISKDVAERIDRRQDLVDTIVAIVSVVAFKELTYAVAPTTSWHWVFTILGMEVGTESPLHGSCSTEFR